MVPSGSNTSSRQRADPHLAPLCRSCKTVLSEIFDEPRRPPLRKWLALLSGALTLPLARRHGSTVGGAGVETSRVWRRCRRGDRVRRSGGTYRASHREADPRGCHACAAYTQDTETFRRRAASWTVRSASSSDGADCCAAAASESHREACDAPFELAPVASHRHQYRRAPMNSVTDATLSQCDRVRSLSLLCTTARREGMGDGTMGHR